MTFPDEREAPYGTAVGCACGWNHPVTVSGVEARRLLLEHYDSAQHREHEMARRSHYDFAPQFPVTVDGKVIAWACSREWALAIEASL